MNAADAMLFDAVLHPHRSLTKRRFALVMVATCAAFLGVGLAFAVNGAWLVLPFCGAEVLLIWWAFHANVHDARRYETLRLTPDALTLESVRPSGQKSEVRVAPPHWARAQIEHRKGTADRLLLTSHGRRIVFGAFLSDHEKQEFADALNTALGRLRGVPAVPEM